MIKAITNLHNVEKIMRNYIISQSGLDSNRVLNANSVRGVDLNKLVTGTEYASINLNDSVILFEILQRDSENERSMEEEDGTLSVYNTLTCRCVIYGNSSLQIAQILKARFESDIIGYNLWNEGIYISKFHSIQSLNEIVNNTVWLRTDFEISLACKLSIAQVASPYQEEQLINITTNKEN